MDLPDQEQLTITAQKYFDRFGLFVVFLSAAIEALLFVGLYYPGGLVILLSVIFTGPDPLKVLGIVLVVTGGMVTSYVINFFLGRHGWYRLFRALGMEDQIKRGKEKLTKYGLTAILLANWHPNFGSIIATAAGVLNFSFKKFFMYSLLSSLCWNIFWGTVAYLFGDIVLSAIRGPQVILLVIAIWIAIVVFSSRKSASSGMPPLVP